MVMHVLSVRWFRVALLSLFAVAALALAAAPASADERDPRIVGGNVTTIAQHPWQAALVFDGTQFPGNDFQRQFCGGSLITSRIVLTAAHCVFDTDPEVAGQKLDPDDVDVILNRTTLTGAGGEVLNVQRVDFHPAYDPDTSENDVGFLRLSRPSAQTQILLAGSNDRDLWKPGAETVISGWGATFDGDRVGSDALKEAIVPMIGSSICGDPAVYGGAYVTAVMVCAGFLQGGTDSCQGDSGGPLTTPAGGPRRLVGVTSFGFGCAQPFAPGIYSRVGCPPLRDQVAAQVRQIEDAAPAIPHEAVTGSGNAPCDDTSPDTAITKGPKKKLKTKKKKAKAKFQFSSNEAEVTFECSVDAEGFEPCTSPLKVKTKKGKHFFDVFATDQYGNRDTSVASRTWKVKRKKKR
jgi:trypsin